MVFSLGRVLATAIQIAPVPPCAGNRKVALGPQLPAVFCRMTFLTTFLRSGAATRSPSHAHCICSVSASSPLNNNDNGSPLLLALPRP